MDRRVSGPVTGIETDSVPLAISHIIGELEILMPAKISRMQLLTNLY